MRVYVRRLQNIIRIRSNGVDHPGDLLPETLSIKATDEKMTWRLVIDMEELAICGRCL